MPRQHPCPRCHTLLLLEDEGTLIFCHHCGAPQVLLSEELRSQAEQLEFNANNPDAPMAMPPAAFAASGHTVPWSSVIRTAALLSAVFSVFVLIIPPMALFVAPAALTLFAARHRETRITASLGTRMGLLCGLFCALGAALLETAAMLTLRLTEHGTNTIDTQLNDTLARIKAQTIAQSGAAAATVLDPFFTIAEFRAGLVLGVFFMIVALILLLATTGGTVAGYLRSRSPAR